MKALFSPRALVAAAATLALSGCLNLKPAQQSAKYYVLSPSVPAATNSAPAPGAIGVAQTKLPDYLFRDAFAVRKSNNEINFLLMDSWAERLNVGFQRVLAADLSARVPAQIRLSEWRMADVTAGVYVTVEQFDVDEQGQGVLVAWWRVVSPAGDKILKSGQFRAKLSGPVPGIDTKGAVATLSALIGQLSEEIAAAVREAVPPRP
jgi:uncharacterized lipoprotein YmbA